MQWSQSKAYSLVTDNILGDAHSIISRRSMSELQILCFALVIHIWTILVKYLSDLIMFL